MDWYRGRHGLTEDPRIAEASRISGESRSTVIAVFHAVLECAARADEGGRFRATFEEIAADLATDAVCVARACQGLRSAGLLDADGVADWSGWRGGAEHG